MRVNLSKSSMILASMLWVILFTACTNQSDKVEISLNEGDKFKQHIFMEVNLKESILTTNMNLEAESIVEVVRSSGGEKELALTYTKLHSELKHDGSEQPSPEEYKMYNMANNMAVGKSIHLTVDKQNKQLSISGLLSDNGKVEIDSMMREPLDSMARAHIKSFTNFIFSVNPGKDVEVGDSWTSNTTMSFMGMNMNVALRFTLGSIKDKVAGIQFDGSVSGTGTLRLNNDNISMELTGKQFGTLNIDMQTRHLKSGNYLMNIQAQTDIMGTMIPMEMKVDCKMEGL
jgi:hypothetical protein